MLNKSKGEINVELYHIYFVNLSGNLWMFVVKGFIVLVFVQHTQIYINKSILRKRMSHIMNDSLFSVFFHFLLSPIFSFKKPQQRFTHIVDWDPVFFICYFLH